MTVRCENVNCDYNLNGVTCDAFYDIELDEYGECMTQVTKAEDEEDEI